MTINGACCSYCGRVCQRRDWPRHKQSCSAYRVSRDSVAGNHAVAARSDTCIVSGLSRHMYSVRTQ